MAATALVLSLLLIVFGIFDSTRFENDIARFMLCLAVATTLAIFWFIFYPERFELALPLQVGTAIRLGGPVALWFGVFMFLIQNIPSQPYARFFEIMRNGRPGGMFITSKEDTHFIFSHNTISFTYFLVGSDGDDRQLHGIYGEFPRNIRSIEATLEHRGWKKPIQVTLTRDGRDAVIDISAAEDGDLP
jgi:hypothetical protein